MSHYYFAADISCSQDQDTYYLSQEVFRQVKREENMSKKDRLGSFPLLL